MIIGKKKIFWGVHILWILALLLLIVVFVGGPGVHLGLWSPFEGFKLTLTAGFMGGMILAGLSLIVIILIAMKESRGGMGKAFLCLFIGLLLLSPVAYLRLSGGGAVPPIHDITTDLVNPPDYIALVGKRGEGANRLTHGGAELAAKQQEFYPDIVPILMSGAPQENFTRALDVARNMGWELVGVDPENMRFEATDYSFWFSFADDIVVIVQQAQGGSRIDMRSVSRVGKSDLGINAKRIRDFRTHITASPLS